MGKIRKIDLTKNVLNHFKTLNIRRDFKGKRTVFDSSIGVESSFYDGISIFIVIILHDKIINNFFVN